MNRDDLLKKCVDRGVADEGSVEAVSHLFYMYLLTALQKGQRVEVPKFGTFGTRVVGVKKTRRMPFFEVERELADRVNQRYRDLKYLVVGRYELTPVIADEEYKGKDVPPDVAAEQMGKEAILDSHRDVTIEEYERSLSLSQGTAPTKERKAMPKLNLKDEEMDEELKMSEPEESVPTGLPLHETGEEESKGPSALLQILIALIILAGLTFALNYFGVVHLWGTKAPVVSETLPEPEIMPPVSEPAPEVTEPTPTPGVTQPPAEPKAGTVTESPKPKPVPPVEAPKRTAPAMPASSSTGTYTVQVSSWLTSAKANEEAARLSMTGLDAFVTEAMVGGEVRYRVRVGRYATQREAVDAAARLQQMMENGIWVARLSSQ